METIDRNKLIGEFLYPEMLEKERIEKEGVELSDNMFQKMSVYLGQHDHSRYHKDWNWLMVGCKKAHDVIEGYKGKQYAHGYHLYQLVLRCIRAYALERTHICLVVFILWYKEVTDGES